MLTEGPHVYLIVHIFIICDGFSLECYSRDQYLKFMVLKSIKDWKPKAVLQHSKMTSRFCLVVNKFSSINQL